MLPSWCSASFLWLWSIRDLHTVDAENSPICDSVKYTDFDVDAIFVQGAPGSPGMPGPTGKPGKPGENGVPVSKYSLDHTLKHCVFFLKERAHGTL